MAKQKDPKRTCGILIYRGEGDEREVLLAKPTGSRTWQIPKGRANPGETDEATARREVWEEVGIRVEGELELLGEHNRKGRTLVFYAAEIDAEPDVTKTNEEGLQEMEKAQYFPLEKALKKVISWQKPFLEKL